MPARINFTKEQGEEIVRLYLKEKMSLVPIGEKFGVSIVKIKCFLKSKDIKLRGRNSSGVHQHFEEIKEMYLIQNKSASEIGKIFKLKSENPILNILRENGVKISRLKNKGKNISKELYPNWGFRKNRDKIVMPMRDSSIELKIQNFLRILGIEYLTHFYVKEIEHAYQSDILIPVQEGIKQKTIIECEGDYFHANPNKYNKTDKIFRKGMTAEEVWNKDNTRTRELQEKGFRVLRFWECDIRKMELNDFENKLFCGEIQ